MSNTRLGHRVNVCFSRAFHFSCISFVKIPGQRRHEKSFVVRLLRGAWPEPISAGSSRILDGQKRESVKWRDSNLTGTYRFFAPSINVGRALRMLALRRKDCRRNFIRVLIHDRFASVCWQSESTVLISKGIKYRGDSFQVTNFRPSLETTAFVKIRKKNNRPLLLITRILTRSLYTNVVYYLPGILAHPVPGHPGRSFGGEDKDESVVESEKSEGRRFPRSNYSFVESTSLSSIFPKSLP